MPLPNVWLIVAGAMSTPIVRGTIGQGIGGHHRPGRGVTDTWLTPPDLLARLGTFDLDPCACPEPRPWPTATTHYALPDHDGLRLHWHGAPRVWLNPPYGPQVGLWLKRWAAYGGRGLALVFTRTDVAWWHEWVVPYYAGILFLRGRLHFHRRDGLRARRNAGGPSALIAFRREDMTVLQGCRDLGWLVRKR